MRCRRVADYSQLVETDMCIDEKARYVHTKDGMSRFMVVPMDTLLVSIPQCPSVDFQPTSHLDSESLLQQPVVLRRSQKRQPFLVLGPLKASDTAPVSKSGF